MIGFIGLGSMGAAMVKNLLDHGVEVKVWNRSSGVADELVELGAHRASSAAEVLSLEISFSMLANDAAAEAVLCSENLQAAAGNTHANMASVSPQCSERLSNLFSAHNVGFVASPVLGRPPVARGGNLNILAAGKPQHISLLQSHYDIMGARTWMLGENPATANAIKIAVNYNIIHAIQALAESVALAEAAGLSGESFVEILSNTLFGGVVYKGYGGQIAEKNYLPQAFSLELGLKDLHLAMAGAKENNITLPTAPVLENLLKEAMNRTELAELDWAAMAEVTLTPESE